MKNRECIKRRRIFLALSLLWMAVIFYFSAQNGSESGGISSSLSELFGLPEWLLRKGAHVTEYAVLGMFLTGFFDTFSWKRTWAIAWIVAVLYAASDEFHQMFSAGRVPSLRDVCIDAVGAALGVAVMSVIFLFCRKKRVRGSLHR